MKSLKALIENMVENEKIIIDDNDMRGLVVIKQDGTYETRYRSIEYIGGRPTRKEAEVLTNIPAIQVYDLIMYHFQRYEINIRW